MTGLWVITSFFNPARYATKRHNCDRFLEGLDGAGVPHLTVECAFGADRFELQASAHVLHVRSTDVLWQKERLLNIAVAALPAECSKVAWADCDVLFDDADWATEASALLEQYPVIQPFGSVVRLPRGATADDGSAPRWRSFAAVHEENPSMGACGDFGLHGHTGFAWAARRDVLDAVGLYDVCIAGSADHLMAHVFAREFDNECIDRIVGTAGPYRDHFRRWAVRADRLVAGRLAAGSGSLRHLWHGDEINRKYVQRNLELARAAFNPEEHISVGPSGAWRWSEAPTSLRTWMSEYFASRKEDGDDPAAEG